MSPILSVFWAMFFRFIIFGLFLQFTIGRNPDECSSFLSAMQRSDY